MKIFSTIIFTSGIILKNRKILVLKKKSDAHNHKDKWDTVGGHLKEFETAEECVVREAKEETGLDVKIEEVGKSYEIYEGNIRWLVVPYLLSTDMEKVVISEHVEFKWIESEEAKSLDAVPDLVKSLKLFGLIE